MSEARVGLVIEDDQDIRELVRVVLSQAGFDVHVASTGSAGVNSARELNPDVITLDLGLPDIDGFEVARQIRKTSDAYIIMLTARAEELDTLMGLEAGGDDYLTKPFRPRELRARVEAMMRRPRSSSSDAKHAPEAADPEMTHNGLAVSAGSRTAVLNAPSSTCWWHCWRPAGLCGPRLTLRVGSATNRTTSAVTSATRTNAPWRSTWATCARSWGTASKARAGWKQSAASAIVWPRQSTTTKPRPAHPTG
jgi:CheY-like chemotaxis protein